MTTDRVSFIVHLPVSPQAREAMRTMLFEVLDAMSAEDDFVNTWVHEDLSNPDMIILYETWACSREKFLAVQLAKPYRQAFEAALPGFLSGERRLEFLKEIRAYPGTAPIASGR
jgi:quinol monooxygenase YgiN